MPRFVIIFLFAVVALANASLLSQNRVPIFDKATYVQEKKDLCKECEKVVASLKKIIDNPQTEQELVDTLKTVCNFPFLASYKERCLNVVNTVAATVDELKSLLEDPTKLCSTLELCKSQTPGLGSIGKRLVLSITSKIVSDIRPSSTSRYQADFCWLCKGAFSEVQAILQNTELMVKVQTGLKQLCKYTGQYKNECDDAIEAYFPKILQIARDLEPEQVCSAVKLCKTSSPNTQISETLNDRLTILRQQSRLNRFVTNLTSLHTMRGINIGCMACEAAVNAALRTLSQPKVLHTISTDITNVVCKIFPKTLQAGCFDFLAIYAVPSLQLTLGEWTPKEICQDVHACSASFLQQIEALPALEKSVAVCDVCKKVAEVLAYELQQEKFAQDIINVLTRGCKLIPGDFSNKCGDLVIEYVPAGLSYVADFFTRDDACSVLRLC